MLDIAHCEKHTEPRSKQTSAKVNNSWKAVTSVESNQRQRDLATIRKQAGIDLARQRYSYRNPSNSGAHCRGQSWAPSDRAEIPHGSLPLLKQSDEEAPPSDLSACPVIQPVSLDPTGSQNFF